MFGRFQLILAQGSAHKEAGQDGLADVHRVDEALEPRVYEADAHGTANIRFVMLHQLRRRGFVPGPYAPDEIPKGVRVDHGTEPFGSVLNVLPYCRWGRACGPEI